MLKDPEDMVILENIRMANQLLRLRLVDRPSAMHILEHLRPLLVYPSAKIRLEVTTFLHLLATLGHEARQCPIETSN